MINIDTRLLEKVNQNELWLLMHLAKRLNKDRSCWPSNRVLLKDLGWSIDKLQLYKKSLIKKEMLKVVERSHPEGGQGSNLYSVRTELIGIYVNLSDLGDLQEGDTLKTNMGLDTGIYGGAHTLKSDNKVLTNEVLVNDTPNGVSQNIALVELFHPDGVTGNKVPNTKARAKKLELPEYKDFCRIWDEHYHHIGFKMPRDGSKIKSLILETRRQLGLINVQATAENVIEFWNIFVSNLHRTWGHGKDLSTIESKYSSLIFDMEKGKQVKSTAQDSASMAFGKYANTGRS